MTELKELEEGLRKLKQDNLEKKRMVAELENEKKYLEERNRFLIEKLKQAGVLYEESGKRLVDFVNENVKPLRVKLSEFDSKLQKLKDYEKTISSALKTVNEFEVVIGNFKNDVVKTQEREAVFAANVGEMKKSLSDISKRISKVQSFGSEELADKVEEIKAKFGEDTRKIEDQFSVLKIGVSNTIENFKKEFERQANALRNEMEKVDIKKSKELGDSLAKVTEELDKTKVEFSKSIVSMEKTVEKFDIKKTKEMEKSLEMLSANLKERFANLSVDLDKRVMTAEGELNRFRIELEKTLGKAKVETRDFLAAKSKEFDSLLDQVKEKTNAEIQASVAEWDKNLGSLRSELITTKKEVEKLIGTINRKVEIGEERRERKIDSSFASIQTSLSKKIETSMDEFYGRLDAIEGEIENLGTSLAKTTESTRKSLDLTETKRDEQISKLLKEFMVIKGAVDEKIKEASDEIDRFSKTSEAMRKQITKESLAGVKEEVKSIIGEMEKKFEVVEDGLIDKISSIESDVDELSTNFQGLVNSVKADTEKRIETLRKELERAQLKNIKESDEFTKSIQKTVDGKFSAMSGKIDVRIRQIEGEATSVRKDVDNFTVDLSQKFDSIISGKTKEFEKSVKSLLAEMKSVEKEVNLTIGEFKKEIQKTETEKRMEIESRLKEFAAERGKIEEKMRQIDIKISEFSKLRKELKNEVYKESVSGVNERVKDIVGGIEERFENSREDMESRISELMKTTDVRVKEVEAGLNGLRIGIEKTTGKLRDDVDKVTGKKTGEVDKIIVKLKDELDEKVNIIESDFSENLDSVKNDIAVIKNNFEKSITTIRKEFETAEVKRIDKTEKIKLLIDRETKAKLDDFTVKTEARIKSAESELKALKSELGGVVENLRGRFDEVIEEKSEGFDKVLEGAMYKTEKTKKDIETLAENLKIKFQSGERERNKAIEKHLKELLVAKGGMERRLKEIDEKIKKFSDAKIALKDEIMKENSSLIESKLSSFSDYKKTEISEIKKSLKSEMAETQANLMRLAEKVGKLNDKMDVIKDEIYTVKKTRAMIIENATSIGKTVEENVDLRLKDFMKDLEKRMKTQESITNSKMDAVEKKIASVSENLSKTKRESEGQLEEILKHVES